MKSVLISSAALAALAAAAPMTSDQAAGSSAKNVPSVFYVNGDRVDSNGGPTAVKGPCTVDDDVYTCAQKTAAQWKLSGTGSTGDGHMTLQESCYLRGNLYPCQIDFDYHVGFTECHISDPVVTDHQDLFDCNDNGGCKQSFTFTTSSTQMTMDGFHIGTSLQAGFNVGFASAQVSVSADWMQSWSNSTTYTSTVTREYDLAPGDVCAPTTIQFETQCTAGMVIDGPTQFPGYANVTFPSYVQEAPSIFVPCQQGGLVTVAGDDKWMAICQALNPSGLAMDVDAIGGGSVWAIQGCSAS